ncbi:hypothetical protein CLV51_102787 [Chitinophaga niastensis]|uniref:Uncharacterized protein n=1 Tax=Chitinophaga niastensis TaxID=536980 RepID=A0A2P8HP22_CHINA|nr:hypothetical protein [Chitinophaga niastensis]PSL47927.1 hypothetical protein CLV51_102787 [Chitinophaga niastensis]
MKKILFFLLLFSSTDLFAYKYGEHKEIGDKAFEKFILGIHNSPYAALFLKYLNMESDSLKGNYYFRELSCEGGHLISYGVLNGLSGDHESNPLVLEEQLRFRNSVIQRIIALHNLYIATGNPAAPDSKLTKLDFNYALQAAFNISHFYEYKKTFQEQLRLFDKSIVKQCETPSLVAEVFKKLGKTNAINMYVTLHTLAIDLAEQSGGLAATHPAEAKKLLFYAFLFNGFADHFLEDAFAAGHLVVNRTILASITNNKALHDFYCKNGCVVVNKKAEIWHAYGDGEFNNDHSSWARQSSLQNVQYTTYTQESERVIEAVHLSLDDIWQAFHKSYTDTRYTPFINTIPDDKKQQANFLISNIPSLALVPIPYNSDLSTLFADQQQITPAMRKANQPLAYRNFVRSRVANSLVIGTYGNGFTNAYFKGVDFRFNIGNFSNNYSYNSKGGKKGTFDYWLGYTVSYSLSKTGPEKGIRDLPLTQQVRAGVRSNFDLWVTDKKFIGLYNYTEAGIQFIDKRASFVFVPAIGFQLASLINLNYYNMPVWLRIPAQYFLPLKFTYCAVLSPHKPTNYYSGLEMDIFF